MPPPDEPNIAGGLSGHPRDVPGASRQVAGGSDPSQGHQAIVKELGELHRGYRAIVEDLGKIKDELKAIGKIELGTGGGPRSFNPAPKMPEGAKPLGDRPADQTRANVPDPAGSSGSGRDSGSGRRRNGSSGDSPRIPNPAGNPLNQNSPEVPETPSRWRQAGQVAAVAGGVALTAGAAAGSFFNREMPRAIAMDTARRNMMLGGTTMTQSDALMRRMMTRYGGDETQYASTVMGLQGQGILAGTQLSNMTVGAAARMRSNVAPEMEQAQLGSMLGSLNTGQTGGQLALMGIRTSLDQNPQELIRRTFQRIGGGQDLTARQLRAIRPGTSQYMMLSQLLGGDEMANLALRQETGRVTGAPVRGGLASDQVRRAEGSRGLLTMELQDEMDSAVRRHTGIVETLNDTLAGLDDSLQNLLTTTGALGSGLGGLVGSLQNIGMTALALRGAGLGKPIAATGRAAGRGIRWAGRMLGRGGGAVASTAGRAGGGFLRGAGRLVGALGGGIAGAGGVFGKLPGIGPWFTPIGQGGYIAPEDIPEEMRQRYGVDEAEVGAGIGDPGQTGGGSLLMQRTHHDASHVTGLHPEMRKRLESLFAANPRLRLNSGYRSPARQKQLWDEAVRKYGSEAAARKWVAPPGKSNHNKGLAADIGPASEYDWLKRNAPRFGLEPYAAEPWHWELAGTRSGAHEGWNPEGGGLQGLATAQGKSTGGDGASAPSSFGSSLSGISSSSASSIMGALGGGVPASTGGAVSSGVDGMAGGAGAGGDPTISMGAGSLSALQIARYAAQAGFSGDALIKAVAIAFGESSGNPRAHNPTPPDDSYGLWQINMLGDMGPARRRQFGLASNTELFDPRKNAQAAFAISSGGSNFGPWSVYTSGKYQNYLAQAQQAVVSIGAGVGDRATTSTTAPTTFTAPSLPSSGGGMRAGLSAPQSLTIQVMFNEATDAQAERFARKVAAVMKGEERIERIGAT